MKCEKIDALLMTEIVVVKPEINSLCKIIEALMVDVLTHNEMFWARKSWFVIELMIVWAVSPFNMQIFVVNQSFVIFRG